MDERQLVLFGQLVRVAYGDTDLVQRALNVCAKGTYRAPLGQVLAYIVAHRREGGR